MKVRQTKDEDRNKKLTIKATAKINKMAISTNIPITTLNVNELNVPIKRLR